MELTERLRQGVNLNENLHERTQKVLNSHPMSSCDDKHEHKAQASRPGNHFGASGDKRTALAELAHPQQQASGVSITTCASIPDDCVLFVSPRRFMEAESEWIARMAIISNVRGV